MEDSREALAMKKRSRRLLSVLLIVVLVLGALPTTALSAPENGGPLGPMADTETLDPEAPPDPGDPADPEDPVDPEDPADPEDPVDPEDPTDPDKGGPLDPEETDPLGLDGNTFSIFSPSDSAAMLAELKQDAEGAALKSFPVTVDSDGNGNWNMTCSSIGASEKICVWTFEYIQLDEDQNPQYHISTESEDGTKYLQMTTSVSGRDQLGKFAFADRAGASCFTVKAAADGKYLISAPVDFTVGDELITREVYISSDKSGGIFGGWAQLTDASNQSWLLLAFCPAEQITGPAPSGEAVRGVSPLGTTIDIFDYWVTAVQENDGEVPNGIKLSDPVNMEKYALSGINGQGILKFATEGPSGNNINVWTGDSGNIRLDMVQPRLVNGYPVLAAGLPTGFDGSDPALPDRTSEGESLAYLFNKEAIKNAKMVCPDVGGLFRVDEEGYYYFDSSKTAAGGLDEDDHTFSLIDLSAGNSGIGFFPFNAVSVYGNGYRTGDSYPTTARTHELDHFFGVHMTTQFLQSPDGKTEEGRHVTYEFSGDDDVWIFLDGVLVGDVGGNHNAAGVTIDFSTGEVTYQITPKNNPLKPAPQYGSTIFEQYQKAVDPNSDIEYRAEGKDGKPGETVTDAADAMFAEVTLSNSIYTFKKSGEDWIFADDTYHTLDFFYLERGGHESNMSLKFNLEEIPPSYIKKVDQDGKPLSGVGFELYVLPREQDGDRPAAQDAQEIPTDGLKVAEGTTDRDGKLLLIYSEDMGARAGKLLSLADLYTSYQDELVDEVISSGGIAYQNVLMLELRETDPPKGYRSVERISLRLENINGTFVLRSNDRWNNGTYAAPSVVVSSGRKVTLYQRAYDDNAIEVDLSKAEKGKVGMFAVVLGWIGEEPPAVDTIQTLSNWGLVHGSATRGWTIQKLEAPDDDHTRALGAAIGAYANANSSVEGCAYPFEPTTAGSYNATIDYLPGEINDYYFMLADSFGDIDPSQIGDVKFTVAFYYSEADSWEDMTGEQTFLVNHRASRFERKFAATINVPNIENRLIVQRLDAVGNTVEGATFGLYRRDAAVMGADGRLTIKDGAIPLETKTTKDLAKDPEHGIYLTAGGSAAFYGLKSGIYYVAEITPPPGYEKNPEVVKVIVNENGVYAYAGDPAVGANSIDQNKGVAYGDQDGISVLVGVGSLVNTMAGFGSIGEIDTTLTDIYVLRARARDENDVDLGRDADSADLNANWIEVASKKFQKLQRKWRVYDSNAALQYKYQTGPDILGKENLMREDENPNGYLSSSGWNWNLISQNYFGIYDQGKSYRELYADLAPDDQAKIDREIRTKTPLPVTEVLTSDLSNGYTSYGNKILNPLFSGSTVIRVASGAYGSLGIAKRVEAKAGGAAPDADKLFPFTVSFSYAPPVLKDGRDPQSVGDIDYPMPQLAGTYRYEIANDSGAVETGTLTISGSGAVTGASPAGGGAGLDSAHFSGQTVLLKDGETLTIEGLPEGTSYAVREGYDEHYRTSWVKTVDGKKTDSGSSYWTEGRIGKAGQADKVTFTNVYTETPVPPPETGELTVFKTVSGNGASTSQTFQFTVTLSDTSISGAYGDMEFRDGVASFGLKANEHKTAAALPAGTTYTVTESDSAGYTVTERSGDTGTIPANGTAKAKFNNHKGGGGPGPDDDPVTVTVNKIWKLDDGGTAPDSVTVLLLRDGKQYGEAVVLNAGNHWTYTWSDLEAGRTWTVRELNVPEGFTESITQAGNTFTITNDDKPVAPPDGPDDPTPPDEPDDPTPPDEPDDPTPPDEPDTPDTPDVPDQPKLPQTGQLWWPVWLLAAAGILTLTTGIWEKKRYHGKHEA